MLLEWTIDWKSFQRYTPSQADVHVFTTLGSAPDASAYPHAARWYTHIKSYAAEHGSLPGSSKAGEAFIATAAPAAADDDEVDLFCDDDDEEDAEAEKLKAERVAAYNVKKAAKPKAAAKVRTIFCTEISCSVPCIYRNLQTFSLTDVFVCSLW
jgi:hypothetical protein